MEIDAIAKRYGQLPHIVIGYGNQKRAGYLEYALNRTVALSALEAERAAMDKAQKEANRRAKRNR